MSAWRKFLEEESEYQWISFAVFTFAVIIGAVLIDWSDNLSGFHEGAAIEQKGIIHDSAGDAIIFENDSGKYVSLHDNEQEAPYATCLVQHLHITFACMGQEGIIFFSEENLTMIRKNFWNRFTTSCFNPFISINKSKAKQLR